MEALFTWSPTVDG